LSDESAEDGSGSKLDTLLAQFDADISQTEQNISAKKRMIGPKSAKSLFGPSSA